MIFNVLQIIIVTAPLTVYSLLDDFSITYLNLIYIFYLLRVCIRGQNEQIHICYIVIRLFC